MQQFGRVEIRRNALLRLPFLGYVDDGGDPPYDATERVRLRRIDDVQQAGADPLEVHAVLVFNLSPGQNGFDVGPDGAEAELTHDLLDFLADHIPGRASEHPRVRFTDEQVAQIGAAAGQQKR